MRTRPTLTAALLLTTLATFGCDRQTAGPPDADDTLSSRFAKGGNGNGNGNGGGPGGGSEPVLALSVFPMTGSGLVNAFSGDGRDGDGASTLPPGQAVYRDGVCGINVGSTLVQSAGAPDTLTVRIFIQTSLKHNDACQESAIRQWGVSFPPNPIHGPDESLISLQFNWEPNDAPNPGDVTAGIGKLNIQGQPQTCNPLRFNPLRDDGLFVLSDYIQVERLDGGWRLFTQPAPENVGQCQDSSGQGNEPNAAGEAIPLDFEFFFDEDVGDGAGPVA